MERQLAPNQRRAWIGIRWGLPCSAGFHLAIVLLVLFALPEPRKPKALPKEIPVEVVRKVPEKKQPPKPKERKAAEKPRPKPEKPPKPPEPEKPKVEKKPPELGLTEERAAPKAKKAPAEPPKVAEKKPAPEPQPEKKPDPSEPKPGLGPEPKKAEPKLPEEKPILPNRAQPPETAKEPQLALGPRLPALRPKPEPPPKPKGNGLRGLPRIGGVPSPDAKKKLQVSKWVLDPLPLDVGNRCGKQLVTGTMTLVSDPARANGNDIRYLAEIRTVVRWERCPPQRGLYTYVLLRRGTRVYLVDAAGLQDHGVMRGNLMVLRDEFGSATWRRQP